MLSFPVKPQWAHLKSVERGHSKMPRECGHGRWRFEAELVGMGGGWRDDDECKRAHHTRSIGQLFFLYCLFDDSRRLQGRLVGTIVCCGGRIGERGRGVSLKRKHPYKGSGLVLGLKVVGKQIKTIFTYLLSIPSPVRPLPNIGRWWKDDEELYWAGSVSLPTPRRLRDSKRHSSSNFHSSHMYLP